MMESQIIVEGSDVMNSTAKGLFLDTNKKHQGFLYEMNKNKVLYAMVIPALIVLIMFAYIPFGGNLDGIYRF